VGCELHARNFPVATRAFSPSPRPHPTVAWFGPRARHVCHPMRDPE
jgi:hypothetical protein